MSNIDEIIVKVFSMQEIADICNTSAEEIKSMVEAGCFGELQARSKNKRDIIGTKEDILEIYRTSKGT